MSNEELKSYKPNLDKEQEERLKNCDFNLQDLYKIDKAPKLQLIDTQNLKSLSLNQDQNYQHLKKEIEKFNEDVLKCRTNNTELEYGLVKQQIYNLLYLHLVEIANTTSRIVQQRFLKDAQMWYDRQMLPIRKRVGSAMMQFKQLPKSISLEYTSAELLNDYNNNNRTKYSDIQPPEERLQQFFHKTTNGIYSPVSNDIRPSTTQSQFQGNISLYKSRPQTKQTDFRPTTTASNNRNLQTADSLRPSTGFFNVKSQTIINNWNYKLNEQPILNFGKLIQVNPHDDDDESEDVNKEFNQLSPQLSQQFHMAQSQQSIGESGQNQFAYGQEMQEEQEEQEEEQKQARFNSQNRFSLQDINTQKQKQSKQFSIVPQRKNFASDQMTSLLDKMGEEKQKNKFTEIRSTYLNYCPSQEKYELRLEERWFQSRNKLIKQEKEHEEVVQFMKQWANNKGNLEEEIQKKGEMLKYGSDMTNIGQSTKKIEIQTVTDEKQFSIKEKQPHEIEDDKYFSIYMNTKNLSTKQKLSKKPMFYQRMQTQYDSEKNKQLDASQQQQQQQSQQQISQQQIDSLNDQDMRNSESGQQKAGNSETYNQQSKTSQNTQFGQLKKQGSGIIKKTGESDSKPQTAEPLKKRTKIVDKYIDISSSQPNLKTATQISSDKFQDLENKMKLEKIRKIRLLRGDIISAKHNRPVGLDDEEIKRRLENCMSIYSLSKQNHRNQYRPFSNVVAKYINHDTKAEQHQEIHRIKSAFFKKGMQCPINQIQEALTKPQVTIERPVSSIPTFAIGAFINPFQIEKKKAKKKPKSKPTKK